MMTDVSFTKMQGAGNDFIIIDNREQELSETEIISLAPRLCHRRFGIGADGIIALLPPSPGQSALDYTMYYRNADGSDAGMCGNGARCLALFAARAGLGSELKFNVHDSVYHASVDETMGTVTLSFPTQLQVKKIALENESELYQVHAGTEHIVQEIAAADFKKDEMLHQIGERLRYHDRFDPPGTNVNFICGHSRASDSPGTPAAFRIKTYERGVEGLTLACGTGAIAAAVTWHHLHRQDQGNKLRKIEAEAEGGTLNVNFTYSKEEKLYSDIKLSGGAEFVYEGVFEY
jgi:diaminopimelate epimerase